MKPVCAVAMPMTIGSLAVGRAPALAAAAASTTAVTATIRDKDSGRLISLPSLVAVAGPGPCGPRPRLPPEHEHHGYWPKCQVY